MLSRVREIPGVELDRGAYHEDFAREFAALTGVLWKLERGQAYREPGDASWEAFIAGDWERALALNDEERGGVRAEAAALAAQGVDNRRLRIVEHPISPYVQWEMQYFRILAEEGFPLRAVAAERVAAYERQTLLPDVVVLGDTVLYHVVQDSDGTPAGARRIDVQEVIYGARTEIARLYEEAEPLLEFFHREVAPLPAPTPHP